MKEKIIFRKPVVNDAKSIFELSNLDYVREYSINPEPIEWLNHLQWFSRAIKNHSIIFYLLTDESDQLLGQIRFQIEGRTATISLSFSPIIRGKGYARYLLDKGMQLLFSENTSVDQVAAYVKVGNTASIRLFEKTGFDFCYQTEELLKYIYIRERK